MTTRLNLFQSLTKYFDLSKHSSISSLNSNIEGVLLEGIVSRGYGRGHKTLGFPTANLNDFSNLIKEDQLKPGVYCSYSFIEGENQLYYSVTNFGISPTFINEENKEYIPETYIINRDKNLGQFYNKKFRLILVNYLRPELKFNNLNELIIKINEDIENSNNILNNLENDFFWKNYKNNLILPFNNNNFESHYKFIQNIQSKL